MHHSLSTQFRGRLSKQMRRCLAFYAACILLIGFVMLMDSFGSSFKVNHMLRRRSFVPSSYQKPLTKGIPFPKKIWQTWRVGPLAYEEREINVARSWTTKNTHYRYEVLTDDNDVQYIEQHYGRTGFNRPDIINFYNAVNATIVKADLLRYLIMYAEGGLYTDIDVEALRPIERFVPERYNEGEIDMVIGVEIDQPEYKDHPILGTKSRSFCQWTFMCKPRLPVMLKLVEQIMDWLEDLAAKQNKPISEVELNFDDIISGTGPSAFTNAILADMSSRSRKEVTWDQFHSMDESKVVNGVLVLDVEAFAAGQGHSDSGNHNARGALVKHHYHASQWPSKHPRFSHPVYGEVERCNWDYDCVRKWDEDVARFKELSEEEQAKEIAIKQQATGL